MRKGTCVIASVVILIAAGCGSNSGSRSKSANGGRLTVSLGEQNGSGESGKATMTAEGERTKVVLNLKNKSATMAAAPQPAHIHAGSCTKLNPTPAYGLTDVKGGESTSTVNVKLDDLRKGSYAINVHKSAADIKTYVACGEIGKGAKSSGGGGGYGY
jgi:hypothetical protein